MYKFVYRCISVFNYNFLHVKEVIFTCTFLLQTLDDNSALKLGCIVTGPAFEDIEGSWDTVQVDTQVHEP